MSETQTSTYHRSYADLIGGPCPDGGAGGPDWQESYRLLAVSEMLRRLPEAAYQALKEQQWAFTWFIPEADMYGGVWPFAADDEEPLDRPFTFAGKEVRCRKAARVLYLSPRLEQSSWPFVVAVVAHQLAYLVLGHSLWTHPDQYDAQEREVAETLEAWGFGAEWRHDERCVQRRERRKERLLQALIAAEEGNARPMASRHEASDYRSGGRVTA